FVFQAEDGIRDFHVTGVQTCALPIWGSALRGGSAPSVRTDACSPAPIHPPLPPPPDRPHRPPPDRPHLPPPGPGRRRAGARPRTRAGGLGLLRQWPRRRAPVGP